MPATTKHVQKHIQLYQWMNRYKSVNVEYKYGEKTGKGREIS